MYTVYALEKNASHRDMETFLEALQQAYIKYEGILRDINRLADQDKWGEAGARILKINEASKTYLTYASTAIKVAKIRHAQTNVTSETLSVSSRHTRNTRRSRSSRASTSSSSARRKALAESASARKQAEFEQIMAETESEKRQREAEGEVDRQQRRAQHERDMAILEAEKRKAVADAKLRAIEQSILEEETPSPLPEQFGVEDAKSRTLSWVHRQDQHDTLEQNQGERPTPPTDNRGADLPKPSTY